MFKKFYFKVVLNFSSVSKVFAFLYRQRIISFCATLINSKINYCQNSVQSRARARAKAAARKVCDFDFFINVVCIFRADFMIQNIEFYFIILNFKLVTGSKRCRNAFPGRRWGRRRTFFFFFTIRWFYFGFVLSIEGSFFYFEHASLTNE